MKKEIFSNPSGKIVQILNSPNEEFAFIPDLLPPKLSIPQSIIEKIHSTEREVARFDGMIYTLQDPFILLQPLKYSEAQTSSDLEGTTVDLVNIVAYEINPKIPRSANDPLNDAREVSNLKKAINYWVEIQEQLPVSLRLLKDLHRILLDGVRGKDKNPGEFRKVQNQVGQGRYVPPPANELTRLLDNLEKWINEPGPFQHPLLRSIIAHYQFEAIHPFRDGNGRVGRLLLSIMICKECEMSHYALFMSSFFNQYRSNYYDFLHNVSTKSDWLDWIDFCLTGIGTQAINGMSKYKALQSLQQIYITKINKLDKSGRLRRILDMLFATPVITVQEVMEELNLSWQLSRKVIKKFEDLGIVTGIYIQGDPKQYFLSKEVMNIIFSE